MNHKWTWMVLLFVTIGTVSGFAFYRVMDAGYYFIANGGDFRAQYIHYFNLFHDLVRSDGLPFWSWDYALGGSFWNDFGYYMLGDVFIWPLLFFPKDWFPVLHIPMSILKLMLMGAGTFLLFHKLKVRNILAFIGALSYTFAGYHFEFFYTHYFFVNIAVFFPFILLGFERYLQDKKPGLFVVAILLASIGNFYFMFIASVGLGMYGLYRYFTWEKNKSVRSFFIFHLKWFGYYLVGLALSMPIFLPSMYSLLHSNAPYRPDVERPYTFGLIETAKDTYQLLMWNGGISFLGILLLVLVILNARRFKQEAIFTVVLLIIITFPFLLSAVGGFSKPDEFRSFPIFNLLLTMMGVLVLNQISLKKMVNAGALLLGGLVLTVGYLKYPSTHSIWIMAILPLIFMISWSGAAFVKHKVKYGFMIISALCIVTFGWITTNSLVTDLLTKSNGADKETMHQGVWGLIPLMDEETYTTLYDSKVLQQTLKNLNSEDPFYRVWVKGAGVTSNTAMSYGYSSFLAYQTLMPWSIQQFEMDILALSGGRYLNINKGYLNHTYLYSLIGNEFIIFPASNDPEELKVYGYEKNKESPSAVYKNQYEMPFGFVYDSVYPLEQLLNAPYGYRDRLLFEHAFIPEDEAETFDTDSLNMPESVQEISKEAGITFSDHVKTEKEADGIRVIADQPFTIKVPIEEHEKGQLTLTLNYEPFTPTDGIRVHASTDTMDGHLIFLKNMDNYSYEISQYHYTETVDAVNFNFGMDGDSRFIELYIQPGEFLIEDLKVYLDDFSKMETIAEQRKQHALEIDTFTNNYVKGTIDLTEKGVLFLSIPYNEGWKVKVDGESADSYRVHQLFTGVTLPEGTHTVELTFRPQGLLQGTAIAAGALLLYILLAIRRKKKLL